MSKLCISITFLDPYFHGRGDYEPEWPPSPWRLFQAIIASASGNGKNDLDAFEWFEALDAPEILAPDAFKVKGITTYVPDNASDSLDRQDRLEGKKIRPMRIRGENRTLHYIWSIDDDDIVYAKRISSYAKKLTTVGWGIDIVAGNGAIIGDEESEKLIGEYPGTIHVPMKNTVTSHRIPKPRSYSNLKMVHETKRNRFTGNIYTPSKRPTVFDEIGYKEKGIETRFIAGLKLLQPSEEVERWAAFDPRDTVYVSSWIRGYLCGNVKNAWNFSEDSEIYVAGHLKHGKKETPPRFSYLPLPSIGHPKADGLIRRVIVAEPYGDDGSKAEWAGNTLNNSTIKSESGRDVARVELTRSDTMIRRYCNTSYSFKTVTPVILPGHDSRNYPKAEKLFLKAVSQAGFEIDDVDFFILQKAPFFNGAYHPNEYHKVSHLKGFTPVHVFIKWKKKIGGPLTIGAGRHRGLGLFVPDDRDTGGLQ